MPWFRVDDGFHSHPKVLAVSLAARGLWVTCGSWSSAHLTDGFIRDQVLASLGGSPELAEELVSEGLWRRRKGGYQFHQWAEKNPTKEAVKNDRENNAERQRRHRQRRQRLQVVEGNFARTLPSERPVDNGEGGRQPSRPPWLEA